jgi:hypothetical protein
MGNTFDPNTWRPIGWQSGLLALDLVTTAAAEARARKKRHEPLNAAALAALADDKLLRDCHATPRWVWRLAGELTGVAPGGWCGDPFHNPWSKAAQEFLAPDAWRFDGSTPELDGLATLWDLAEPVVGPAGARDDGIDWAAPAWPGTGAILANGPHSANGKWVPLCARAGRTRIVVAVVPSDAVGWYFDHGLQCDAEVQLGRIDYDPPPGLPDPIGNERCSSLLIWAPESRVREIEPAMILVPDDRGKTRRVALRPALRTSPQILDLTPPKVPTP